MPDWVSSNAWSIAGVSLSLASIGLAILIALVQRRTKRIVFEMLSRTQLIGVAGDIPELDVSFRGQRVADVEVVDVRISNDGNIAVSAAHYERPIRVSFGDGSAVLTAEVEAVHPKALRIACHPDGNGYVVEPVLLNSGDWVRVKSLVSRASDVDVDFRILGVARISKRGDRTTWLFRGLLGFGLFLLSVVLFLSGRGPGAQSTPELLAAAAALLGAAVATRDFGIERSRTRQGWSEVGPQRDAHETSEASRATPREAIVEPEIRIPDRSAEPWVPSEADLDAALGVAERMAANIGPDAVLRLSWIDVFPVHEINFRGTSEIADRYFIITVDEAGAARVYGVRKLGLNYQPQVSGNEAPWRTVPGWQELVSLSWLRVVKPFTGVGKMRVLSYKAGPAWQVSYETQGAIWEATCYVLADGKPSEVAC